MVFLVIGDRTRMSVRYLTGTFFKANVSIYVTHKQNQRVNVKTLVVMTTVEQR